jgi:hypothetical protein
VQILPPRRSVYGLRAPRVATVSGNSVIEAPLYASARPLRALRGLGALGRTVPGAFDPETGATVFFSSSSGTAAVPGPSGVISPAQKLGTLSPDEALGPNVGAYVAGANLFFNSAKLAYNVYQSVTNVPVDEMDIYLDAGSGGDVGDAGALIEKAKAETTPAQKNRVEEAVKKADADPKQVAAQAAEMDAKGKDPGYWDDLLKRGEGIYSKCIRATATGQCVKYGLNWLAVGAALAGTSCLGYIAYKVAKDEAVPPECEKSCSRECLIAAARTEKGKLARQGVPGANAPVPNPSNEEVLQSWLDAIEGADSESEIDSIVEAAKRLGISGEYLQRIEDAAKAAKAKLASKKTMLYVGLGVGVVAIAALVVANRR